MNSDLEGGGHGRSGVGGDGGSINRREQRTMNTVAIHGVYLAFIGLQFIAIQLKYQNLRNSPYKTHMVMTSSIVALFVYVCAASLQIILVHTNNELHDPRLLNHVLVCTGVLSVLSNALMFLSNMVGCIVVVPFLFATAILLAYDVCKLISKCISERNNSDDNYGTPTSEPVALVMSTGISHNEATSESTEMSTGINHNESSNVTIDVFLEG